MQKQKLHKRLKLTVVLVVLFLAIPLTGRLFLPLPLFHDPYSTVRCDRQGDLLGARIAADGQWRFPETDSLPARTENCFCKNVIICSNNFLKTEKWTAPVTGSPCWRKFR